MRIPSLLRRPYVVLIALLLLAADVGGIVHAFRRHGTRDGVIALALPPYGLYRAGEALGHPRVIGREEAVELAQSDDGRRTLATHFRLKPKVWGGLLDLVMRQKNHQLQTVLDEGGMLYDATATVPPEGPVELTITTQGKTDLTITVIDADRDQKPDALRVVKQVNGKPETHEAALDTYTSDEASQFLLAWALTWGTIAEEQKAAATQPPMNVNLVAE